MRKAIDDGNIDIGVFVYLQKAFDSVYHQILLGKLSHYGIRFKWSYLPNRNQSLSRNGYNSGLATISFGVPEGSLLGPLLFLLYINDLNQAITFRKVHHFPDETNPFYLTNSIQKTEQTSQCWLEACS